MKICTIEGCQDRVQARGWCNAHYQKWRIAHVAKHGPLRKTADERFWSKINKDANNGCWEWMASISDQGYGLFKPPQRGSETYRNCVYAHRYSWEIHYGMIPDGMVIDHKCWNRSCVNPAHLHAVTQSLNQQNRSGLTSTNTSGFRGVSWLAPSNKWRARATLNKKSIHIGMFETAQAANEAVIAWRREYMPNSLKDRAPHSTEELR